MSNLKNIHNKQLSIIVNGVNKLGFELAELLIENNGYVIFIDEDNINTRQKFSIFSKDVPFQLLDYSLIPTLDEDIKKLEYVFFLNGQSNLNLAKKKNYLDTLLSIATKFSAKFLLSTFINQTSDFTNFAEQLVLEYAKKVKLNARIVAIGELLGDGIDFTVENPINKIILNAAKGEALEVPKNGMQKDYFVHILDAAHGIYKAQLSRITSGGKYLVAFKNPFTYISIAYKIQEIENSAQDIEFYEPDVREQNFLGMDIENLSEAGWIPKVSLEKALKQSISSAKIYLIESEEDSEKRAGMIKKLRNFFDLTSNSQSSLSIDKEDLSKGPVARLILERKRQEEQVRKSLQENAKILSKKEPLLERRMRMISGVETSTKDRLTSLFTNLKNRPKSSFVKPIFLFLVFISLYLFVLSPLIVLLRNGVVTAVSLTNLEKAFDEDNYESIKSSSENISYALGDSVFVLDRYSFLFRILGIQNQYTTFKSNIESYEEYAKGVENIIYGIEPILKYTKEYRSNLELRTPENGYIGVSSPRADYQNTILDASDRSPYLRIGIDKIDKSLSEVAQLDYNLFPQIISDQLLKFNQKLRDWREDIQFLSYAQNIPDLLGVYEEKNYYFVLLDNTIPRPIGGEIVSLTKIKVLNGGIEEIITKDKFSEFTFDQNNTLIKDSVALNSFEKDIETNNLSSLSLISEKKEFSQSLDSFFQTNFGNTPDGVFFVNLSALEGYLFKFSNNYQFISDEINFSTRGLLQSIPANSEDLEQTKSRNQILTDLFVQVITNFTQNLPQNLNLFFDQTFEELQSKDLNVFNESLDYLNAQLDSDIYSRVFFNTSSLIPGKEYLSSNINTDLLITNDQLISYKKRIKIPELLKNQEVGFCIPLYISPESVKVEQIDPSKVSINNGKSERCLIIKSEEREEISISMNINNFKFENTSLDLDILEEKINGISTQLDLRVISEPEVKITQFNPLIQNRAGEYILSSTLSSDLRIRLTISK